jgi:hypothetical protein
MKICNEAWPLKGFDFPRPRRQSRAALCGPFLIWDASYDRERMTLRPNDYHLRRRNLQADKTELSVKEKLNLEIG